MNRKPKKALIIAGITSIVLFAGGALAFLYFLNDSFWITSRNIKLKLGDTEELAVISIDEEAIHPSSIALEVVGHIDGQGLLSFDWSDTSFYRSDTLSGEINICYEGDWYSDTICFKYEPITATRGELTINCDIFSSRK